MTVAIMSTKGQLVIPTDIRRQANLEAGDGVVVEFVEKTQEIRLRKAASLVQEIDQMSSCFTSWVQSEIPPLEDASAYYETREPRL